MPRVERRPLEQLLMLNDPHKKLSRKNFFISAAVVMLFASVCSIEFQQKTAFADSGTVFPSVVAANSQTQIASGIAHSCFLSRTGTVKCWGSNSFGQLGKDNTATLGDGSGEMAALGAINLGTNKTATAITAGDYHTCALLDHGTVKCWGLNSSGQLGRDLTPNWGDSTGEMALLGAINLGTNKTATAITAGGSHTCALLNDGTVKCWGLNSSGQLGRDNVLSWGDGTGEMAALGAINLGTNKTATAITAGQYHTCALLNDGTVKCWGLNSSGQLGKDSTANLGDGSGEMAALGAINLGTNKTATAITAGGSHTCALLNDGTVKCWGLNSSGQLGKDSTAALGDGSGEMAALGAINLGTNKTATAITAGGSHTCALLNDGTVKCWGLNSSGQLGRDNVLSWGDGTGEMAALGAINLGTNKTATAITAGGSHTCALLNDGTVKCWGLNSSGQLGKDSTAALGDGSGEMAALGAINLGTNKTAVGITAGQYHTCALLNDGTVKCWGLNSSGQLGRDNVLSWGDGTGEMAALGAINLGTNKTAVGITAGASHTCALLNDGTVKCWGLNSSGQLGKDSTANLGDGSGEMAALGAINLGTNKTATAITAGQAHTCALLNDGTVKCWGLNSLGQLGKDSTANLGDGTGEMAALGAINLGTNKTATAITAGQAHTCALLNDGTVKCWGLNSSGQLGKDSTANLGDGSGEMAALGAINLGTNKTATAITAGQAHTCALLNDGTVKCWGLNSLGQLGKDSTAALGDGSGEMAALGAINLGTNKTATAITAGQAHTCALLNDGTVKCWGLNIFGGLGRDNTIDMGDGTGEMAALGAINLGTNQTALTVAAGEYHTCALLDDGTVKCWGLNSSGQLGKDSTTNLGDGTGEMAALAAVALAAPSSPTSVTVVAGYLSVAVSWTAPVNTGQSPITSYTASASNSGGTCTTASTSCTISNLSSTTSYTFTVTATNNVGTSASSSASAAVTPLGTGTTPGAPTNIGVVAGDAKLTVTWTAPTSSGSSTISGYTATTTPGGKTCTVAGTVATCVISGLSNGTAYTAKVYAFNQAGTGTYSVASASATPMWSNCHTGQPEGYWLLERDGQVYNFGQATALGSLTLAAGRTAIDIEASSSGCGYWVIDSVGVFHRFGDAGLIPQANLASLLSLYDFGIAPDSAESVVSVIPSSHGTGAYVFTSIGRVIRTGTATAITDSQNREDLLWIPRLNSPIVDARLTTTGSGYWLLAADGGVFSFGDAHFSGAVPDYPASQWISEEIVSFAPDLDGKGYVVVAKSGKAWWFDHPSRQQLPDVIEAAFGTRQLNSPIAAVTSRKCGGYTMVATDGGVFAAPLSDCGFQGSLGANPPNTPIIALTPIR